MKLYANNRTLRGVAKGVGDDEQIHIELKLGNKYLYHIYFTEKYLTIFDKVGKILDRENNIKGVNQKGEKMLCSKCLDKGIKNYNPCEHDN